MHQMIVDEEMYPLALSNRWPKFNRLRKSLKATIIASFSYNSFKRLANWSLEDMFFRNTFKSLRSRTSSFLQHTGKHETDVRCILYSLRYSYIPEGTFLPQKEDFCTEGSFQISFFSKLSE